ncbi:hypothetical protein CYY_006319 [Polysphondylium violaceum]|uniref:VPS9 domain-containing protein n=1 Tax=Polysphondylium violaceum TaxID=133409 RepID=A0A8J4UZ24_9MYCE|nr:hypothetical protein CYY_006319 [Polysphondylium violaceum]
MEKVPLLSNEDLTLNQESQSINSSSSNNNNININISPPPPLSTNAQDTNNNNNEQLSLSKKEILGVLLVDSFSNFYIQKSILVNNNSSNNNSNEKSNEQPQTNTTNPITSPTVAASLVADGYKDHEITSFLIQAFYFLSIPNTALNYLLLTNKKPIQQLSKVSSQGSIHQISPSNLSPTLNGANKDVVLPPPLLNDSTITTTTSTTSTTTTITTTRKESSSFLPQRVDVNILRDLDTMFNHHFFEETHIYSKNFNNATLEQKKKLYFDHLFQLTKKSLSLCPTKYSHLVSSENYYSIMKDSVEFYIVQNIYHHIFPVDYEQDTFLYERIESLNFIETSHLCINNFDTDRLKPIFKTFAKINAYQTPNDKLRCLSRTLIKLVKINGEENLLPMFIYLILKTNPPSLWSNLKFLELYVDQENQNSLYDYALIVFSMAIKFIEKLDHTHLSIDTNYFSKKINEYNQKNNNRGHSRNNSLNNGENNNELTTTTTTTTITSLQISETNYNELTEEENRFKQFKETYRTQSMIELVKNQLTENEVEELLLKFISISLINQEKPAYHSLIRYSLKRFFIFYLGIEPRVFLSTEMHTIGTLQDNPDQQLDVLPTANKQSSNREIAMKTVKIAGAAVTGAVLVGLTGGLAAPFIGGVLNFVGAGSVLAGLGTATGISGSAALSVVFGAAGAKVSAEKMISATSGVQDYSIHKIKSQTSLHAIIGVYGFTAIDTVPEYYKTKNVWDRILREVTDDYGDIFLVEWEKEVILKLKSIVSEYQGTIAQSLVKSVATNMISATLAQAFVPLSILKVASVLDNPWTLLKDRSEKAGKILAQQIIDGYFGNRPLTLIGTGMGSRLIFSCLEELFKQSQDNPNLFSLIEMVIFMGSPVSIDPKRWSNIIKLISGRLVNCYTQNDTLLKYLCRSANILSDGILPAAGVSPVHIASSSLVIENVDVSNLIKSHLDYEKEEIISKILQHIDINNVKYCNPKISPLFSGIVFDV